MFLITVILLFFSTIGLYIIYRLSYWKRKGVKYAKTYSVFGTISENVLQKKHMALVLLEKYKQFPNEPYIGIYTFLKPTLLLIDMDLIKQITTKESDVFVEHRLFNTADPKQVFMKNLFACPADVWKITRGSLSPAFSISKIKGMYSLVESCCQNFLNAYSSNNSEIIEIRPKEDIMFRFTNDAIATCIFGLDCNSFKEEHHEFLKRNADMGDFGGNKIFALFGYCLNQFIVDLFKLRIIPEEHENFFINVVSETIKLRKQQKNIRPDMIHFLMESQKKYQELNEKNPEGPKVEITDIDIMGHSLLFLIAGTDTTSIGLNFTSYELAMQPEIQEKLYQEIIETAPDGKFDYEKLTQMKYLDMVITESLRKWPPLTQTDRCLIKSHTLKCPGKPDLYLEKGTVVWIPFYSIQRDPRHYENPDKFDPERFSDENKSKSNKDVFMTFGLGPRACIGSRLGLLMIKSMIVHILYNFEIVPVEKTPNPLVLSKKHIFLSTEKPIWLGLKRRTH